MSLMCKLFRMTETQDTITFCFCCIFVEIESLVNNKVRFSQRLAGRLNIQYAFETRGWRVIHIVFLFLIMEMHTRNNNPLTGFSICSCNGSLGPAKINTPIELYKDRCVLVLLQREYMYWITALPPSCSCSSHSWNSVFRLLLYMFQKMYCPF